VTNRYKGKYFSVLGDSMSTLQGVSQPEGAEFYALGRKREFGVFTQEDTWWGMVIDALGGRLLVCDAFSGSTVTRDPLYEYPSYGCSNERTGSLHRFDALPDVIMVLLGANDRGMRVAAAGESTQLWAFEPAYGAMVQKLKNNYPRAEIWCLSIPTAQSARAMSPDPYSAAIKRLSQELDCRFIDLTADAARYSSPDDLHPDRAGMERLAGVILAQARGNR